MYGIIRLQKVKATAVAAMQYHNDRLPGKHSNRDIDPTRSHMNVELAEHGDYADEVRSRIDERRTAKRAVRKDAVVLVEGLATASPEFFEGKTAEDVDAYFADVYGFVCREFGRENVVHFTVHMDETIPHAHFGFTPIKDGSLSWKRFFPDKAALQGFQDRFFDQVGEKRGLERGEVRPEGAHAKRHLETEEYKRKQLREVKAELAAARDELARTSAELESAKGELAAAKAESAKLNAEGKRKKAENRRLDEEIAPKRALLAELGKSVNDLVKLVSDIREAVGALLEVRKHHTWLSMGKVFTSYWGNQVIQDAKDRAKEALSVEYLTPRKREEPRFLRKSEKAMEESIEDGAQRAQERACSLKDKAREAMEEARGYNGSERLRTAHRDDWER